MVTSLPNMDCSVFLFHMFVPWYQSTLVLLRLAVFMMWTRAIFTPFTLTLLMIKMHSNTEANGWNFFFIIEIKWHHLLHGNKHLVSHWITLSHCVSLTDIFFFFSVCISLLIYGWRCVFGPYFYKNVGFTCTYLNQSTNSFLPICLYFWMGFLF